LISVPLASLEVPVICCAVEPIGQSMWGASERAPPTGTVPAPGKKISESPP
jgi:hypothetical protein